MTARYEMAECLDCTLEFEVDTREVGECPRCRGENLRAEIEVFVDDGDQPVHQGLDATTSYTRNAHSSVGGDEE